MILLLFNLGIQMIRFWGWRDNVVKEISHRIAESHTITFLLHSFNSSHQL